MRKERNRKRKKWKVKRKVEIKIVKYILKEDYKNTYEKW
jgi:hypothetical protein